MYTCGMCEEGERQSEQMVTAAFKGSVREEPHDSHSKTQIPPQQSR